MIREYGDVKILDPEYHDICDLLDELSSRISNGENVSISEFDARLNEIIPCGEGYWYAGESLLEQLFLDNKYVDVFAHLYGDEPKFKKYNVGRKI